MANLDAGLKDFFLGLVGPSFYNAGVVDRDLTAYVAGMLTEFADGEQVYRVRDAQGRALKDVGEMLLESDPVYGPAPSFDREREVRKHIGDYTLFFTGMFPESVNHHRLRKHRLESFVDFVKAGKESYHIVAQFDMYEYANDAALYERLSRAFERCVFGLNGVRQELDLLQHPIVRRDETKQVM
ncbi:MAG: hypothetical protein ABI383_04410 [Acidobacteriaceae bacterium]